MSVVAAATMVGPLAEVAVTGVGPGAPPAGASPGATGGSTLQADQAKASRLASRIQAEDARVTALAQQFDQARMVAQDTVAHYHHVQAQVATAHQRVGQAKNRVRKLAVADFVGSDNLSQVSQALQGKPSQAAVNNVFLQAEGHQQQAIINRYNATKADLASKEAALAKAAHRAQAAMHAAQAADQAAQKEVDAQRATLGQVQGRIAQLVSADQAQQAARRQAAAAAQGTIAVTTGAGSSAGDQAAHVAEQQEGKPYQYGAAGPNSYDCSGLTMYSWEQEGVSLPHNAAAQYSDTRRISQSQLQPGDLVFYGSGGGGGQPGHVTIYIGNNDVVSANSPGTNVQAQSIYYDGTPMGFGRVP
ncbi:MAG TPA: C40 family peptidase [Acidimicrobiales bacterium]|nr:C40 family peptidase [Acidimicrobiales bacterium]